MCFLSVSMRQRQIVVGTRLVRVERKIELVLPTELKTSLRQCIVSHLSTGVALRQIRRMSRQFIGNNTLAHIFLIR